MSGITDRRTNFCKDESNKLMLLLKEFPDIVCKKTDHTSNKQKDAAWKLLADKFNADATSYRSVKQLQQKYNNLKKTARKEMAAEKYGRRQTGGGPAPPAPSETSQWLNSIMGESISGLPPIYDSDALDATKLPISVDSNLNIGCADINLEFLDDNKIIGSVLEKSPQTLATDKIDDLESVVPMESHDLLKENISSKNDAAINVFDATTPKSMLRKPLSKELVFYNKRKSAFTPLETRKHIIMQTNKKIEFLSQKQSRENDLARYALEEHNQNMAFKKEAHEKAMKQQDELHELEINYRKKMYDLILQKCTNDAERAKLQLKSLSE